MPAGDAAEKQRPSVQPTPQSTPCDSLVDVRKVRVAGVALLRRWLAGGLAHLAVSTASLTPRSRMEAIQFDTFRCAGANEDGCCDCGQLAALQPGSPFWKNVAMLKCRSAMISLRCQASCGAVGCGTVAAVGAAAAARGASSSSDGSSSDGSMRIVAGWARAAAARAERGWPAVVAREVARIGLPARSGSIAGACGIDDATMQKADYTILWYSGNARRAVIRRRYSRLQHTRHGRWHAGKIRAEAEIAGENSTRVLSAQRVVLRRAAWSQAQTLPSPPAACDRSARTKHFDGCRRISSQPLAQGLLGDRSGLRRRG